MTTFEKNSYLSFQIPSALKDVIERAATLQGQSVSEFAVGTLVEQARVIIRQESQTVLTNRDRDRFIAILDDDDARPNAALLKAAERYKRGLG